MSEPLQVVLNPQDSDDVKLIDNSSGKYRLNCKNQKAWSSLIPSDGASSHKVGKFAVSSTTNWPILLFKLTTSSEQMFEAKNAWEPGTGV